MNSKNRFYILKVNFFKNDEITFNMNICQYIWQKNTEIYIHINNDIIIDSINEFKNKFKKFQDLYINYAFGNILHIEFLFNTEKEAEKSKEHINKLYKIYKLAKN